MSEKLIIRNFGPISTVELDLRRVNILIGDQGTGKSTVAKILYIIKDTINNINTANSESDKFSTTFVESLNSYGIKKYLNEKSYIAFRSDRYKIVIENNNIQFEEDNRSKAKNTNLNYYIPAFREAYILLRNNYPAILNAKANLPVILNTFGQHFNNYREDLKYFNFQKIIGVDYVYNNANEFIVLKDGQEISFEESSSAINSVVPMLVVISGVIQNMSAESPRIYHYHNCPFITIEEPELNCFPSTQNELVKFLIEKIKFKDYSDSKDYYCNLLITTHSPYILTSLNNLMYAYSVGQKEPEEVNKIIEKKYWVNPADVSAYRLLPDGTCENIIASDEDGTLIRAEKIDEVSGFLNEQFDKLLNLEFVQK